jgi:cysteine synthase
MPLDTPKRSQGDAVLDLIGNTPMVEATRLDTGPCQLFLKLENQNPGGSIKDRIGLSMIEAAESDGRLKPGGTIVEATAGNTGLGLALVAVRKGYKLVLVIPDKMSREKVFHLKAMGVEVVMTRSDVGKGHPDYYQDIAEKIAAETGAFYVNQFGNEANTYAHETTTGPEIWEQMGHKLDAVVCGVGSSGTLAGLTRFFRKAAPNVAMVLADPAGSILGRSHQDRQAWRRGFVADRGHRRGLRAADRRPLGGEGGLLRHRRRELRGGARAALEGRHPRRLLDRDAAGRRRCATAARARSPSAWSRSSPTAATSTSRRCTTTTGSPTRASAAARATTTCAT